MYNNIFSIDDAKKKISQFSNMLKAIAKSTTTCE